MAGTGLVAATYGLVRLAYGLFLPDVQADLSLSTADAGLISSGASATYCTVATIAFFVAARHPRTLVVGAALTASVGATGMAASHHPGTFAVYAVMSSAGGGLVSPGLVTVVHRNVAAGLVERSQARVNAGTGPGLAAAGILAVMLLPDWRLAWFCVGAFTVAVAVVVLVLDRGDRRVAGGSMRSGSLLPSRAWFAAHQRILVAVALMGASSAAVWNYGRTLLVDAGASATASVSAWIALGVGGTFVIATAAPMSALHPRTAWTATTLTAAAASAALALAPGSIVIAGVACAAFGWGYVAASGALIGWTTSIDAAHASAGTSLLFTTLVLGQAVGATAIGAVATSAGAPTAFFVAGVIAVAAATTPIMGIEIGLSRLRRCRPNR